ncbi:hypothetical protein BDV97DRAFT_80245 [Delphinella strobiligena]|nr:hypothetical protein BDV97DRAFT_80245 [Delphinella strobiligena]
MDLFATRNEAEHYEQKKKVANSYNVESLLKMKNHVDDRSRLLIRKSSNLKDGGAAGKNGKVINMMEMREVVTKLLR